MSASVDNIHAQLASILERFAKHALLEMSRAVEQEMARRQMEVEALMLKLQLTESELRTARQNQNQNLRSVGTQANNSGHREPNLNNANPAGESQTETHTSAQTFTLPEDGIKSIRIKEEHMEDGQWDSGPISPALCPLGPEGEDQDSFGTGTTAGAGSDLILTGKVKAGGMWSVSEEYPANSGAQSLDASPLETGNLFHVVSFVDTEEVEVVPAVWVKNGVCLWPPFKDEGVQKASESLQPPQDSWAAYKVKIMHTANNYSEALRRLPLVEQQMDLQDIRTLKPKIKRNRRLLEQHNPEEEATPQNRHSPKAPQTPPPCKRTILSASDEPQKATPPLLEWTEIDTDPPEPSPAPPLWREGASQDRQEVTSQSPEPATPSLWQTESSLSCCDPFIRLLLHDLTTKQEIVMEQQMSLIKMVADLQAQNVRDISDGDGFGQRRFPIADLRSLSALEHELRSCPETRRKVVDELGLLGGVDVKDTVWRIMKQAIKNDLAKTVNWRGVNGKTSFQSLEFKSVVIEAVRRNPTCAQITELEVEKAIIRWFHLAGDREGGRKKRAPLQDVSVEN
ncbi:uncharacterized protein [Pseudorasbora parva]|uniref:uncharacterized protein isoform X2 n=1 Tax=Pseudorasbora parva TaxID=51549 RepID=UPI00351DD2A0